MNFIIRSTSAPMWASLAAVGLLTACFPETDESPSAADASADVDATDEDVSRTGPTNGEVIRTAADLIASQLAEFQTQATALQQAVDTLNGDLSEANLSAAQSAWRDAMYAWQVADVMQVGPAARMSDSPGGEGLRDEVYSWPIDNPCRVDLALFDASYTDAAFDAELPSLRGLDALEYLLFAPDDNNACSEGSSLNEPGAWDSLSAEEIATRRAAYADVVAEMIVGTSAELVAQWAPATGAYYTSITTAGEGSEHFATQRDALNALSDALFYIDKETKDMKLARPTGLSGCAEATCPEEVESFFARVSIENARANVEGLSMIYHGGDVGSDAPGFHDLLIAVGAEALATELSAEIVAAGDALDAVDTDLVSLLGADLDGAIALHTAVKDITDLLKSQFVVVLDLDLPQRAAGDND